MHEAIVSKVINIRPIKGADRIFAADVSNGIAAFATVVIGNTHVEGEVGLYFPPDLQLSEEFCTYNDLIARYDENGTKIGGGYFNEKRRVTAQRFKGVRSDGLWMPLSCVDYAKPKTLRLGDVVSEINGHVLCQKYFTEKEKTIRATRQGKVKESPYDFPKHVDTQQLLYEIGSIPAGARIIISEKMHGTSHRVGHVAVRHERTWLQRIIQTAARLVGKNPFPAETFEYVHGTRNTIISREKEGFHGNESFRFDAVGEVYFPKNMIVYGEIVGYANGKSIMPSHSTADLKELRKLYGNAITYTYGCEQDQCYFVVYRVTQKMGGVWVDLPLDQLELFCHAEGFEYVLSLADFIYDGNAEALMQKVLSIAESEGTYAKSHYANHPAEGVVLRVEFNNQVHFYKYKSFAFKVMEGITKADDSSVDLEAIS